MEKEEITISIRKYFELNNTEDISYLERYNYYWWLGNLQPFRIIYQKRQAKNQWFKVIPKETRKKLVKPKENRRNNRGTSKNQWLWGKSMYNRDNTKPRAVSLKNKIDWSRQKSEDIIYNTKTNSLKDNEDFMKTLYQFNW